MDCSATDDRTLLRTSSVLHPVILLHNDLSQDHTLPYFLLYTHMLFSSPLLSVNQRLHKSHSVPAPHNKSYLLNSVLPASSDMTVPLLQAMLLLLYR